MAVTFEGMTEQTAQFESLEKRKNGSKVFKPQDKFTDFTINILCRRRAASIGNLINTLFTLYRIGVTGNIFYVHLHVQIAIHNYCFLAVGSLNYYHCDLKLDISNR